MNLIEPFQDIINQWKIEFEEVKIYMKHLSKQEANKLSSVLKITKHFQPP